MSTHQPHPLRPYLFRAYYDWMVANQLTPYVVVKAPYPGVKVSLEAAKDGKIILNISPKAVIRWCMDIEQLSFNTCFQGVPEEVVVPMAAIAGIYAKETGAGTLFTEEPFYKAKEEQAGISLANTESMTTPTTTDRKQEQLTVSSPLRIIK